MNSSLKEGILKQLLQAFISGCSLEIGSKTHF